MAKREKIHARTPPIYGEVAAANYDTAKHDLSPWSETPGSTRVSRYRYDYINHAMQVQWRNGKGHGHIYFDVPYESYRAFARVASKGRAVNERLNGFEYREMTADELSAPSNSARTAPARARG